MNRWRVLEALGIGSYGAVYLVEDIEAPGVTYALKLALRPSDTRAEREVDLLARTEHPNVVRIHECGTWQGVAGEHPYFVMDWVQGLPLHTWVETLNPPFRELARVASTLALTLDALHSRGVRHRDLKPEHILIRASDAQPVLIDFGVGRREGASTLTSTVVPPGTVHLRTPEALDFHRLNFGEPGARYTFQPTDDLYALGVCLFRALTGYYPFPPDLPGDLLMLAIVAHVPPPVAAINRRVPLAFSDVVVRLLEKKPEDRHGSGRELHQALETALILGRPEAWDARVFEWEAGGAQAAPPARRTVRPPWTAAAAVAAPALGAAAARGPTTGRLVVGTTMRLPPSAGARVGPPGAGRLPPGPHPLPRKPPPAVPARRHAPLVAHGVGALLMLVTMALTYAVHSGWSLTRALGLEPASSQERPRDDGPSRPGPAPGTPPAPARAERLPLAASPASADAAPMTQPQDAQDVKSSTPTQPLAKTRGKSPNTVSGALGTVVAACVGAACSGPQHAEPERTLAALRQPRPPPQECPPGALEAMKELQFGKVGIAVPDGSIVPFETAEPVPLREGPAMFKLDERLGTLPRHGTVVAGRLFFADGRIHGWFTEARTKEGRSYPVCMVLMSEGGVDGLVPEGAGEEPGSVLASPLGRVGRVKLFK